MDLHQHLRQEHLRTQRAAQAAWVAEQAQKTSKETTEPSQTSSTSHLNHRDPDIVARNPPITDPDNLRNLTPAQFNQDQKAFLRTRQDQSRPSPTPAAVPVPRPRVCPDQAGGPPRLPASSRERDCQAQNCWIRVEWIFSTFFWEYLWRFTWAPVLWTPDISRAAKCRHLMLNVVTIFIPLII